jgi:hypothetical protein
MPAFPFPRTALPSRGRAFISTPIYTPAPSMGAGRGGGDACGVKSTRSKAALSLRLAGARQADREFGEFVDPAVDLDRAAVLLGDDVIGDREAEPGAFPGGLGRNEL